jgi:hypothetical protein
MLMRDGKISFVIMGEAECKDDCYCLALLFTPKLGGYWNLSKIGTELGEDQNLEPDLLTNDHSSLLS